MSYVDKQEQRSYQRDWVAARRLAWVIAQGAVCNLCGSVDSLEVDHIDPALKTMQPGAIWSSREEIRVKELSNCQLLCVECHKIKTAESRYAGHGTASGYRNGCRCLECKAYSARIKREYRAKQKLNTIT